MALKFCYQNEIHRCSDLPASLAGLNSTLAEKFKTELPRSYKLTYSLPDQGANSSLTINTQEDYTTLLNIASIKPVKVFIEATNEQAEFSSAMNVSSSDYDIIQNKIRTGSDDQKELYPKLESVVEQVLVPEVKKHSYFDYQPHHNEQIRSIVRETLREQLPSIVSLVKEAVLKELREPIREPIREVIVPVVQHEVLRLQPNEPKVSVEEEKVQVQPVPSYAAVENLDRDAVVYQGQEEPVQEGQPLIAKVESNPINPVVDQVKSVGNSLKDKLTGFAGKAKNILDDWSQKIEGDPYVMVEGDRYPQSVINKANGLKDIFPDEDRKALRDFVNKYPRYATLEQLANAFLAKDQVPEAADIADQ